MWQARHKPRTFRTSRPPGSRGRRPASDELPRSAQRRSACKAGQARRGLGARLAAKRTLSNCGPSKPRSPGPTCAALRASDTCPPELPPDTGSTRCSALATSSRVERRSGEPGHHRAAFGLFLEKVIEHRLGPAVASSSGLLDGLEQLLVGNVERARQGWPFEPGAWQRARRACAASDRWNRAF
jgi:hypothetical protein